MDDNNRDILARIADRTRQIVAMLRARRTNNETSMRLLHDLLEKQQQDTRQDVALVRLEQLYPLPEKQFDALFSKYGKAKFRWVQEEPANMGAWTYLLFQLYNKKQLELVSRPAAASPATGFKKRHEEQQKELVKVAFE